MVFKSVQELHASSPETSGSHPLKIGANSRTVSNLFTGSIDEVGVWNRALTNIEIANLKNNGVYFLQMN